MSFTERTVVELEPLLEELARIRRRGYATALGEYEIGLNAVAAPVHDARGAVIAAVDIWGPAFRLTPRRIPELAAQARDTAAAISVRLGGAARNAGPVGVVAAATAAVSGMANVSNGTHSALHTTDAESAPAPATSSADAPTPVPV
jgi:hypothetical protein